MKYEDFDPVITRLIAMFPQRPIGPETIAVYWEMLGDMDADVFRVAVNECGKRSEWFPTIAAIYTSAGRLLTDAGALPPTAETAWGVILQLAQRWGDGSSLRNYVSDETIINAVSAVGGMMRIAMSDDFAVRAIEHDFVTIYAGLRDRNIREGGLMRLGLPSTPSLNGARDALPALR